jgi:hypothetical protein
MPIARRAFAFAGVALLVSVLLDALLSGGYQGAHPVSERQGLVLVHALVHASVFATALIGSAVTYRCLRARSLSAQHAGVSGLVFGMVGVIGGVAAFPGFGLLGAAVVLLLLAAAAAAGGTLFFGREGG